MNFDHTWRALLRPGDGDSYFALRPLPAFDLRAPAFDAKIAWWLAEMSRLIYRSNRAAGWPDTPSRMTILRKVGIKELTFVRRKNAQWALNRVEGAVLVAVLVFRGTSGFENWLANLKVIQSPWERGGKVHSGFKAIFLEIRDELEAVLRSIAAPIIFTGHSLGGALAVLAASFWRPMATYTFGAPRVGDSVFRESLSRQSIFRIANQRDIVPSVPPSRIPFEFCHIGESVLFQIPDECVDSNTTSVDNSRLFAYPPRILSEHAPINYSASLVRHLKEEA
jgi:triacylglycerol lipase